MQIKLLSIGKTDSIPLQHLIDDYEKRLRFYVNFEHQSIPALKNTRNLSVLQQKEEEGKQLLKKTKTTDSILLLDECGKNYSSVAFSTYLQRHMNIGIKRLVFMIGGPYGFSDTIRESVRNTISLSAMTFSHQMIRLFFTEQLYRAFTILNNEPYHHQ